MEKRHKFDYARALVGTVLFLSVQGCAMFGGKSSDNPEVAPPLPQLAPTTQNLVLPVEVAHDISILAAGGSVTPINDPPPAPKRKMASEEEERDRDDSDVAGDAREASVRVVSSNQCCCCGQVNMDANTKTRKGASVGAITYADAKGKPKKGKVKEGGGKEDYTVKADDTLMKISFEKFGNVYRWREIYNANRDRIPNFNQLVEGTVLKIQGVEYVVIEKNGLPYLIRRNDTLVKISRGLYNTPKRWKNLWENNRQLIHDPNKIYAGFTLYYQPEKDIGKTPTKALTSIKGPLSGRLPAAKK